MGDTINGGAGDDQLVPAWTRDDGDVIDGGAGTDKIFIYNDFESVGRKYDFTKASTAAGMTANGLTVKNVEAVTYVGSDFNDTVTGATGNDLLIGGGGKDSLAGGTGDDVLASL